MVPTEPPGSQASQLIMATRGLLLLASWALLGALVLQAEARPAPYGVKLCGREFIRAVIFTCGGSRWRRADILAHDPLGECGGKAMDLEQVSWWGQSQNRGCVSHPWCTLNFQTLGRWWQKKLTFKGSLGYRVRLGL